MKIKSLNILIFHTVVFQAVICFSAFKIGVQKNCAPNQIEPCPNIDVFAAEPAEAHMFLENSHKNLENQIKLLTTNEITSNIDKIVTVSNKFKTEIVPDIVESEKSAKLLDETSINKSISEILLAKTCENFLLRNTDKQKEQNPTEPELFGCIKKQITSWRSNQEVNSISLSRYQITQMLLMLRNMYVNQSNLTEQQASWITNTLTDFSSINFNELDPEKPL